MIFQKMAEERPVAAEDPVYAGVAEVLLVQARRELAGVLVYHFLHGQVVRAEVVLQALQVMGVGDDGLFRITPYGTEICEETVYICPVLCLFARFSHTWILAGKALRDYVIPVAEAYIPPVHRTMTLDHPASGKLFREFYLKQ